MSSNLATCPMIGRRLALAALLAALLLPAAAGPAERPFAPPRGQNRILVLLVNFSDTSTTYTPAQFQDLFFGEHESTMRDFYRLASYGQLDHIGDVVGWLRVSKPHDYYANNEYGQAGWKNYPANAHALVMEAVDLAEAAGVNFRLYDNPLDGATDGLVDTLVVVHQGRGGEVINNPKNIWSFTGALSDGGAFARNYDGVLIDQFIIIPEVSYRGDRIIETGPVVHEYGHLLGLIDVYDKDGGSAGMGIWEFMSNGVWGGDRLSPQFPVFPSAYTRLDLGWAQPVTVAGATQGWFALPSASRGPQVLKIPVPSSPLEFFLAEYRPKTGYDRNLPAAGVAVYHVDYRSLFENRDSLIGCGSFVPRVALEQADGRYDLELYLNYGDTSDLFPRPSGLATAFHAATLPDTLGHDCRLSGLALSGFVFAGDTAWVYARSDDYRPASPSPWLIADRLEWVQVAGDGDRYLEDGEIFQPALTVANNGADALGLSASLVSDSPFLLMGSTELFFGDVAPGATASAAGGPYLTVLPGYFSQIAEPLTATFSYAGGSQEAGLVVRPGSPGILYVDDDGGAVTERHLGPYLLDYGLYHDRWEVANAGPPSASDLAGYPVVLWVTGLVDQPLSAAELSALRAYLDGGGTLILSSAYLLIQPTAGAADFARDYLHVGSWVDDRYAIDRLRGIINTPLSHYLWHGPMNFYYPLFNRTSGLTPDALAAGAVYNDRTRYTTVHYPAVTDTPTVFRTIFHSFGIENMHRADIGVFLRRNFNLFDYRPGRPWAVYLSIERAQPRKVNFTSLVSGFGFSSTDQLSFSGRGVTVASSNYLSVNTVNLGLRVAWDADPGWHDLIVTTAAGNTARVPRMFKVEGQPLPNHGPDANAGLDQTGYRNTAITLSAAASADADYDTLAYHWIQTAGPTAILSPSDSSTVVGFMSGSIPGVYKFDLTVSDPFLSDSDSVAVTIVNRSPTARAGADQAGYRADLFILNALSSSDPDSDPLDYRWVQTSGPVVPLLPDDTAPLATFIPDPNWVGNYTFRLEAEDPWVLVSDTVHITIANHTPVAHAGPNRRVAPETWVTLDASASFDLDGDPLAYEWTQNLGPEVTLDLTDPVHPRFFIQTPGNYHFSLNCSDQFSTGAADGVTVVINLPPVADAGPNPAGYRGDQLTLDGSLSLDPNGDPIVYLWEQLAGPGVSLAPGTTAAVTSFTAAANFLGDYTFRLTVADDALSDSDTVTVTIINHPPDARAGADQAGLRSQLFLLDGDSSADPEGDPITLQWQQLSGPPVAVLPSDTATAVQFAPAPDWIGRYVFELFASDPWDAAGDTVAVTIFNQPPLARAGDDLLTVLGDTVTLDGDSSFDPDGDGLDYQWQQLAGPTVALDSSVPSRPTFIAAATGNYLFQLVVDDSFDPSAGDTVAVVILSRWNHRPTANAGPDQAQDWINFNPVQLDGSASTDPDSDPLVYLWTMVSRPPLSSATLSNTSSPTPTFNDDYLGTYVLRLSVYDGEIWSLPDEMAVVTSGNTIDTDRDGAPDCLDLDDDNDAMVDAWETAHGLDPLSALDADPVALNFRTDPDGDGNGNIHEYYNGSDPRIADRADCSARLGGCYFGEADGDFFYSPTDLAGARSLIKGVKTNFPAVYPHNGDTFDLDGDGFVSPTDISLFMALVKGGSLAAAGLPAQAVMVSPGYTVTAAPGATVGLSVRVVNAAGTPRSGLAVVFQLLNGTGRFLGGEGSVTDHLTLSTPEVNTSANESAFALSRDELEIFIASDRPGGLGGFDIYTARREKRSDEFGTFTNVGPINSSNYETTPALSADRLEIFFARYGSSWDLWHATRPDIAAAWQMPEPLTEINSSTLESAPSITDDGLTLYFVRYEIANPGHQIHRARRLTTSSPFGAPETVTELNSASTENLPNISGDDTRIYFMSNRNSTISNYNIWYAERANPSLPFSAPTALTYVNTSLGDLQAWESGDRLRLYFTTYGYHATSDVNLYLVRRPSPNLPYWTAEGAARFDVTGVMMEGAEQDSGGRARMVFSAPGCGAFDIAAFGSEDRQLRVPGFSAARLIRVTVPCP